MTLSNARVTSHVNGVNNSHLGFQMVGQPHLLDHTIFEYGDYGLHYVGTLGHNNLQAWSCTFRHCLEGLFTDDKGADLHSCYFSSNGTGWNTGSMSNPSLADQGMVGGSIGFANIKGFCYNSLNSAPLTIKDPNTTYNTDIGVEIGRTVVAISCGTISYNTNFGIAIGKAATLKMDNGANVTCVGNGVTVGLSFANYIYLYNGVNDLMPVLPQSYTAVAGTLISSAPPLIADKNNWNGTGFSFLDYNITYNAVPVSMNDNFPVNPVMPCGQADPNPHPAPGPNDPLTNCNDCDFITTEDFTNERLNEATQEAIERAEDNSGNNYVEAVDLFSQILMEDYINPTNKEKYLLGMNYLEMLGALGNAFKSGQLTWQMNTVSLDSSMQKVLGVLNKLIDFAITNNDYTARLSYSLDRAAVYRMADRRDLAIALLNSVGSWVQQDDAVELVRLNCIYSAEQQAVLGQIETYDLFYALNNCSTTQTQRRANPSGNSASTNPDAELSIEVFPNPVSSDLTVITSIENGFEILMDAMGQKVYSGEFANEHLIDVSNFANGIYSLEIKDRDSGKKIIRRICIQ